MPEFFFSIHRLVKGRVKGSPGLVDPVRRELYFFEDRAPVLQDLDLDVCLDYPQGVWDETFAPAFSWHGRHMMARWQVHAGEPSQRPFALKVTGNAATRFIVSKWIVEPAIRIAAERKGALMTHAAALSDGERAVLVAGPGGAGKTTWVLRWLDAGRPFAGDDFSLLDGQYVLAYPTPLRLGARHLASRSATAGLSSRHKLDIALRTALRHASMKRLKMYFKARVELLVPEINIAPKSALAGAIWLSGPASKNKSPAPLAPEDMAARMARTDLEEMHGFGEKLFNRGFWEDRLQWVNAAVSGLPCFVCAGLPPREPMESMDSLIAWLKDN